MVLLKSEGSCFRDNLPNAYWTIFRLCSGELAAIRCR